MPEFSQKVYIYIFFWFFLMLNCVSAKLVLSMDCFAAPFMQ